LKCEQQQPLSMGTPIFDPFPNRIDPQLIVKKFVTGDYAGDP